LSGELNKMCEKCFTDEKDLVKKGTVCTLP
jgi:hypothetical protein